MKILITGGCGFVGSNLAIFLKNKIKRSKIYSIDNLFRKGSKINENRLVSNKIKNFRFDIANYKKLSKLTRFDLIIDCCAEPSVEASAKEQDRVFNTNLLGTFNILKKCKKDGAKIIFLSSSRIYSMIHLKKLVSNENLKKPIKIKYEINETFNTSSPRSIYGMTKFSSEEFIKEYSFAFNVKYLINRFGVISGPWQFGKQDQGFVALWMYKHLFKKTLSYIGFGGHGNQIRDVIHIDDVCEILLRQIKNIKKIHNHTFNIGGGIKNSISLKELTKICQIITKNKILINKIEKTSKYDIPYYVTDNKKINKYYNWYPKKNLSELMKDIYEWLLKNKKLVSKYIT